MKKRKKNKGDKQYNPNKTRMRQAKKFALNYQIAEVNTNPKKYIILKDGNPITKLGQGEFTSIEYALTQINHKWSLCTAVFCRDQFGKKYIKSVDWPVDRECKSIKLNKFFAEELETLMETVNKQHFLFDFWIASPIPNYEFKESELWTVVNHSNVENELITESERLRGVKYG